MGQFGDYDDFDGVCQKGKGRLPSVTEYYKAIQTQDLAAILPNWDYHRELLADTSTRVSRFTTAKRGIKITFNNRTIKENIPPTSRHKTFMEMTDVPAYVGPGFPLRYGVYCVQDL